MVKVKKQGDYYWKETIAPSGYQVNPDQIPVSNGTATVTDPENPKGSLTLSKNLKKPSDTAHTTTSNDTFTFTVVLTAPVGTNWNTVGVLTFKKGSNTITPSSDSYSSSVNATHTVLTRTIEVNLPADSTSVTIGNIPSGTTYYVTETAENTNYSSTPVSISETKYTGTTPDQVENPVTSMEGTIPDYTTDQSTNNNVSYAVTNQRKVDSLTLGKTVSGTEDALSHAGVNQNGEHTSFTFKVTLTAPSGIHLKDYISWTALSNLGASEVKVGSNSVTDQDQYNSASGKIEFKLSVKAGDGTKTINNLPYGTTYTVTEAASDPAPSSKSGEVGTATEISTTTPTPTVTITNNYTQVPKTITLFKQDAESHAGIPGAQFYLVKLKSDLDITNENVQNDFKTGTIANDTNDNNTLKLKVGEEFKNYFMRTSTAAATCASTTA